MSSPYPQAQPSDKKNRFVIRRLHAGDGENFRRLRLEALTESPTAFGAAYRDEAALSVGDFIKRMDGHVIIGGFDSDQLVAIAALSMPFAYREKTRHKATINAVYVQKTHRGTRLATELMQYLLACVPATVSQITLTVSEGNMAARRLYEKFGFHIWGTEPRALLIDGIYYEEWHMAKLI